MRVRDWKSYDFNRNCVYHYRNDGRVVKTRRFRDRSKLKWSTWGIYEATGD